MFLFVFSVVHAHYYIAINQLNCIKVLNYWIISALISASRFAVLVYFTFKSKTLRNHTPSQEYLSLIGCFISYKPTTYALKKYFFHSSIGETCFTVYIYIHLFTTSFMNTHIHRTLRRILDRRWRDARAKYIFIYKAQRHISNDHHHVLSSKQIIATIYTIIRIERTACA